MHDELPSRVRELEVRVNLARIDEIPERLGAVERATAPIPQMQEDIGRLRDGLQKFKSTALYGVATILFTLVASGKMTIGEVARLIGALSRLYYSIQ